MSRRVLITGGVDFFGAYVADDLLARGDGCAADHAPPSLPGGGLEAAPRSTHPVPLAEAGAALELLRTRPAGFVKPLVTP